MQSKNKIQKINEIAPYISEEDLDNYIVSDVIEHFDKKLKALAYIAYGQNGNISDVARRAFIERARAEIRNCLYTYIFKAEHWRDNRNLESYISTSLNRLAKRINWDSNVTKKTNKPVCPACKTFGHREFLIEEGKYLVCLYCKDENRINIDKGSSINFEAELKMRSVFAKHSRLGCRCPECRRFIPQSINGEFGIACPYMDCVFFGDISKLESMTHPLGLRTINSESINADDFNGEKYYKSEIVPTDVEIEIQEGLEQDLNLLTIIIQDQIKSIKRVNSSGTMLQKLAMYEAYQNVLKKFPEDIIAYLVYKKQRTDFPMQSKIFQEYASIIENSLPYTIKTDNSEYDIVSLLDPSLQLFDGISEFDAYVRDDYTIPNNTVETYVGGRKFKCYGPCFIGMLIDVIANDISIINNVEHYSFSNIKVDNNIVPGTKVSVKHFRIIPHYEMGAMVYLQRIRKKIVESIEKRKQ